jgi:hypothetical protein
MFATIPPDLALQRDTMQTHGIGQDPSQIEGAVIELPAKTSH